MPTTSTGKTVYAEPATVEEFVQTQPENFSKSTTGSPSEWILFLEQWQIKAKARIDSYCDRDFEDHPADTVALDGGDGQTRVLRLPYPVRNVTEVRADGSPLDPDSYHVKKAAGTLIKTAGRLRHTSRVSWPAGYGNIEVDCTHGYSEPPEDISLAEMKLVDHTLVGMAQKREGMVIDAGDISARINLPISMNGEIRKILDQHKRVEVFI